MSQSSDGADWLGFWIGQQPVAQLCVTHVAQCGAPGDGRHRFLVEALSDGSEASFECESPLNPLRTFSSEVRSMYETLTGTARLAMESAVSVDATIDRFGHVFWKIAVHPAAGTSSSLLFTIDEDQTQLWNVTAKIEDMLSSLAELGDGETPT